MDGAGGRRPCGEGAAGASSRRSSAARREAQRQAALSAELAVARLTSEVAAERQLRVQAEEAVTLLFDDVAVAGRVRALLPALRALCRGEAPDWLMTLRRNVALHAEADGVPDIASAGAATLRGAQKGPRLGPKCARQRAAAGAPAPGGLRRDAAPFWPMRPPGAWDLQAAQVLAEALGFGIEGGSDAEEVVAGPPKVLPSEVEPFSAAAVGENCENVDVDSEEAGRRLAHPEPIRCAGAAVACGYPDARRVESAVGAVSDVPVAVKEETGDVLAAEKFTDVQFPQAPMIGAMHGVTGEGQAGTGAAATAVPVQGRRKGALAALAEKAGGREALLASISDPSHNRRRVKGAAKEARVPPSGAPPFPPL